MGFLTMRSEICGVSQGKELEVVPIWHCMMALKPEQDSPRDWSSLKFPSQQLAKVRANKG